MCSPLMKLNLFRSNGQQPPHSLLQAPHKPHRVQHAVATKGHPQLRSMLLVEIVHAANLFKRHAAHNKHNHLLCVFCS